MTTNQELVERLTVLHARATQGEWELQDGCSWRRIGTRDRNGCVLYPDTYSRDDRHPDLSAGKGEDLYDNLRFIVESHNAFPALLALIERQSRMIEEARTNGLDAAIGALRSWAGRGLSEQMDKFLVSAANDLDSNRETILAKLQEQSNG